MLLFVLLDCFRDVCLLLNIIEIDGAQLSVRKAAQKNAFEKLNSDVSFQNIMTRLIKMISTFSHFHVREDEEDVIETIFTLRPFSL